MLDPIHRNESKGTINLKLHEEVEAFDIWIHGIEIRRQVRLLAKEIISTQNLTVVPILSGGAPFGNMLARMIHEEVPHHDYTECYMIAKRTNGDTLAKGDPILYHSHIKPEKEIKGRDIVLIDDILDSGRTLTLVKALIESWEPSSLKLAVVVDKQHPGATLKVDFRLFTVPYQPKDSELENWFCGFGMDAEGRFRNLEDIIEIKHPNKV